MADNPAIIDRVKYGFLHPMPGLTINQYNGQVVAQRPLFLVLSTPPQNDWGGRYQAGWYAYREDMDWEGPFVTRDDAETFAGLNAHVANSWLSAIAWNKMRAMEKYKRQRGEQ